MQCSMRVFERRFEGFEESGGGGVEAAAFGVWEGRHT